MFKLFITDDEQIVIDGIKESIVWAEYGIQVAGWANNGTEALERALIVKPDIMITDIKMPGLNGLELVNRLKDALPGTKIILISAYEQFEYAREAIGLGVISYVTKPFKKQQILEEVIRAKKLLEEKAKEEELKLRLQASFKENLPILREHFLNSLIMAKESVADDLENKLKTYSIDINKHNAGVFVCKVDMGKEPVGVGLEERNQLIYLRVVEMANKLMTENMRVVPFHSYNQEVVVIYSAIEVGDISIQPVLKAAEDIKDRILAETGVSISIGLGRVYFGLNNISLSYRDAVRALNYRLVYGENTVIYIDHVEKINVNTYELMSGINHQMENFKNIIATGKEEEVLHVLEAITVKLHNNSSISYHYIQQVYAQLLSTLLRTVIEMNISPDTIMDKDSHPYQELFMKESFNDLDQWFKNIVINSCKEVHRRMHVKNSRIIARALDFMGQHCHENIAQTDVADHVGLNPSYFSRYFREETGYSFVEYMKKLRIEKAKELLKSGNMKVYKISEALGYQSVQYFTTLFKSMVGVTPQEYKEMETT